MNRFFCDLTQSSKRSSLSLLKDQNVFFSGLNSKKIHTQSFFLAQNLGSYLESCYDRDSLAKVHSCVITQGLEKDTFLGSKLLNLYAKFKLLRESKWVFNKIICDDLSLWNSIIIGYFRAYQFDEVLGVYLSIRRRNIGLNSSAITFLLTSCVQLGNYEFGRNVHSDALKFGLSSNHFVSSSFIGFYAKFDQILEAANVFDEIIERDVVAYTSLISGYARAGDLYANEGFRVVHDMQRHGFEPNRVTLVSLLQCASRLGSVKEGKSIQGYALRRGLGCGDEIFETTLMDMHIKCGNLEMCTAIFEKMNRKSTASWNVLIAGCLWLGQPLEALSHICRMVHEKYEVDLITLANGLLSCADLGHLLTGKSIHCYALRRGLNLDLVCTTALVDMYSKCKHLSGAINIFFRTEDKDSALFDVMISGYLYNGCVSDALVTFCEMITRRIKPYTSTIIRLVSKSSDFTDIKSSKSMHGYVFKLGFEASTDIANQFIDMYAKCGLIEHARLVFHRTKLKDRVSWTSLMTGLVNHGLADEAISLFREMQRRNINLDSVTFTCLLQALNSLGSLNFIREIHSQLYRIFLEKDVTLSNSLITAYSRYGKLNVASILFEQMTRRHQSTWNTMIAAYGMHGNCVKALELFDQMEKHNLVPDEVTFKSLLSSCSHAGFVREGLSIFNSMEEKYGISPSKEHYGCVVDLLGRAGRVNEAYDLVKHEPLLQNGSVLGALLAACRLHGYYEVGRMVGKWILEIDPCNKSAHFSVSNLFAGEEKWEEVAVIGAIAKGNGMKRTPGLTRRFFRRSSRWGLKGMPLSILSRSQKRVQNEATVTFYLLLDNRFRVSSGYLGSELQETVELGYNRVNKTESLPSPIGQRLPGAVDYQSFGGMLFIVDRKWALGLQSRAHPREIIMEVLKALQELNVFWKNIGHYNMKCRWVPGQHDNMDDNDSFGNVRLQNVVKFEVQLYKTREDKYLLDLQRVQGLNSSSLIFVLLSFVSSKNFNFTWTFTCCSVYSYCQLIVIDYSFSSNLFVYSLGVRLL